MLELWRLRNEGDGFGLVGMGDLKEERGIANKGLSFDDESSLAAFESISLRR